MFSGVFALQPIRAPTPVGASQGCASLVAHRASETLQSAFLLQNRLRFPFSFAPFVSKKSGVSVCALQNRCSKATQTVSTLFLFETKGTKMKIESQAILLQLVLTAKHRQLLRNHQLWLAKRKMPMCLRAQEVAFLQKSSAKKSHNWVAVRTHR